MFSRCGMRCDLCLIWRPNVEKEDRREAVCAAWRKMWAGYSPDPKQVICDGCRCEREDAVRFDPACKVRACVLEKGLEHCGCCEQYPCGIFPAEPSDEEVRRVWGWGSAGWTPHQSLREPASSERGSLRMSDADGCV